LVALRVSRSRRPSCGSRSRPECSTGLAHPLNLHRAKRRGRNPIKARQYLGANSADERRVDVFGKLQQPQLAEAGVAATADNDVVVHRDAERAGHLVRTRPERDKLRRLRSTSARTARRRTGSLDLDWLYREGEGHNNRPWALHNAQNEPFTLIAGAGDAHSKRVSIGVRRQHMNGQSSANMRRSSTTVRSGLGFEH